MMTQFPLPAEYSVDGGSWQCPSLSQQRLAQTASSTGSCSALPCCSVSRPRCRRNAHCRQSIPTLHPSLQALMQPARNCCRKTATFRTRLTLATTSALLSISPLPRRATSSCCPSCHRDSMLCWLLGSRMQGIPEQSPSRRSSRSEEHTSEL